jgi:hypothetical protein
MPASINSAIPVLSVTFRTNRGNSGTRQSPGLPANASAHTADSALVKYWRRAGWQASRFAGYVALMAARESLAGRAEAVMSFDAAVALRCCAAVVSAGLYWVRCAWLWYRDGGVCGGHDRP